MKKFSKTLFLVGAALLLLVPMLATNIKPAQVSEIDNRQLQEFPALQVSGFRSGVEGYVSDRIGFRSEMITIYQQLCDVLFHKLVHPSYIYGKDDHIMAPWDLTTYQHLDVNEGTIEGYTDHIQSLDRFCQDQGIEFLFFLCPNKETIYPEYFPDGYNIKDQPNRSDLIVEMLTEKEVPFFYPRDTFLALKEDELLYNVKYDAGHWNERGAFYAYQEIVHYLNGIFPGMGELEPGEFEVGSRHVDTLLISHFGIDEMIPQYAPITTDSVEVTEVFDQMVILSPNDYHKCFQSETARQNGAPRVLVFGDSYLESAPVFFGNHCAEFVMLHVTNMPEAEYYISAFQPDVVIYEMVERAFPSWDGDYRITKQYHALDALLENAEEGSAPFAEAVSLEIDMAALRAQAMNHEIVSYSGSLDPQIDPSNVYTLAAVLNGKEYYPVFDKNTLSYSFAFRAEDVLEGSAVSFFLLKEAEK